MKKFLFLSLIVLSVFTSCKDKCQFNKNLVTDYSEIVEMYPNAKNGLREAELNLTDSIHVADPKTVDVTNVLEVYQATDSNNVNYVVFREKNFAEKTDTVYTELGTWVGSGELNPEGVRFSLTDALRLLQNSGLELPETTIVTFRVVLSGRYLNPLYIFGSKHTFYTYVDAITGDCGVLDSVLLEEETQAEEECETQATE